MSYWTVDQLVFFIRQEWDSTALFQFFEMCCNNQIQIDLISP